MSIVGSRTCRTGPPICRGESGSVRTGEGVARVAIQLAPGPAQLVDGGVPAAPEHGGRPLCALLEKALADARARGLEGQAPLGYGWLGKWILANTEPPPKRKSKAPRAFTPAYGQPITAVLPTFLHLQEQLALQLEQASGLDLARVKVPAPMGPLRFNLHLTFAWIAAHERRHLWQARQVLNHAEFPRAK